jgi:hypothetical protein
MYLAFLLHMLYMLYILIFIYIIGQYFFIRYFMNMFIYVIGVKCIRVKHVTSLCVTVQERCISYELVRCVISELSSVFWTDCVTSYPYVRMISHNQDHYEVTLPK